MLIVQLLADYIATKLCFFGAWQCFKKRGEEDCTERCFILTYFKLKQTSCTLNLKLNHSILNWLRVSQRMYDCPWLKLLTCPWVLIKTSLLMVQKRSMIFAFFLGCHTKWSAERTSFNKILNILCSKNSFLKTLESKCICFR